MFSKKDWFTLGVAAFIGILLVGVPVYFMFNLVNKYVVRSSTSNGTKSGGLESILEDSVKTIFSSIASQESIVSTKGEPKKIFSSGQEKQLLQFLKTEKLDESLGLSDVSSMYTGENTEELAAFTSALATLDTLPTIENEVYIYVTKDLCMIDIIYFNSEKNAAHYYVGSVTKCSPSFGE